jgi:hypothetical protein
MSRSGIEERHEVHLRIGAKHYRELNKRSSIVMDCDWPEMPEHEFEFSDALVDRREHKVVYVSALLFKVNGVWWAIVGDIKWKGIIFKFDKFFLDRMIPPIGMSEETKDDLVSQCVLQAMEGEEEWWE